VGDRLFKPGARITLEAAQSNATIRAETNSRQARVKLSRLKITRPKDDDRWTFDFVVSWKHLSSQQPLHYQVFFTELSSELPMEAWRYVEDRHWVWDPRRDPAKGSRRMRFHFLPKEKAETSTRRDVNVRTLLVHLKGPHTRAGHNYLQTTIHLQEP